MALDYYAVPLEGFTKMKKLPEAKDYMFYLAETGKPLRKIKFLSDVDKLLLSGYRHQMRVKANRIWHDQQIEELLEIIERITGHKII